MPLRPFEAPKSDMRTEVGEPWSGLVGYSSGPLVRRVQERWAALECQRLQGESLLEALRGKPLEQQLQAIRDHADHSTWSLCELVLETSWKARFDDARRTLELARMAVEIAEKLDTELYGPRLVFDMQGRAWAFLGNALRINSEYKMAEEAFDRAEFCLRQGSADPLEEARFLHLKGSLRSVQERIDEGLQLLGRARRLYSLAGDRQAVGTCYAELGVVLARADEVEKAVEYIAMALDFMDSRVDEHWYLVACHNLIVLLELNGQTEMALDVLHDTRPLFVALGDRLNLTRVRFLEGTLYYDLGRDDEAEAAYLEARDSFLSQGIDIEAAEVAMELALLYCRQGRCEKATRLAREILPVLEQQDMNTHTMATLTLLREAVAQESVTVGMIEGLLASMRTEQKHPHLRF